MISYHEAENRAKSKKHPSYVLVQVDHINRGWTFAFSTSEYMNTGDLFQQEIGGFNVFIDFDGRVLLTPSHLSLELATNVLNQGEEDQFIPA